MPTDHECNLVIMGGELKDEVCVMKCMAKRVGKAREIHGNGMKK